MLFGGVPHHTAFTFSRWHQNENGRGTTCWLPKTHRRAQGVTHCQGGALQYATIGRKSIYSTRTTFILPPKNLSLNKPNHMSCRKRLDLGNKIHRAWNRSRESWHDHELFHLLINYNNKIYVHILFLLIFVCIYFSNHNRFS